MRKINNIKTLHLLLKAEKSYFECEDKLRETGIFGNDFEIRLGFSISDIILDILGYSFDNDWIYERIWDYLNGRLTLDEITKILLEN